MAVEANAFDNAHRLGEPRRSMSAKASASPVAQVEDADRKF